METLHGFPYFRVEFNKTGKVVDPDQVKALTDFLGEGDTTDLFVISHGWNNDMKEAHNLYSNFFARVRQVLDDGAVAGLEARKFAIMAVFWPSHKFAERELIPGGVASLESPFTDDLIEEQLEDMKRVFNTKKGRAALEKAKTLVPKLEDSKKARTEFADLLRSILPKKVTPDVDGAGEFSQLPGDELIEVLSKPVPVTLPKAETGGGASMIEGGEDMSGGGAAGLGEFFSGLKSGAAHLLNLVTYYQMKERSGLVGSTGVNEVLQSIRKKDPKLKLHLIGHSFGGRLVTSAVAGKEDKDTLKVDSLTLLQAAFSHYGFSEKYDETDETKEGFFRRVVTSKTVSGPVLISCTKNDKPVGMGYPLASLLAGQVAASLGDENDKYGGIGRNGAQKTPEASSGTLLKLGDAYAFQAGKLHNLNSDETIMGHSDICHNEVAYAILNAVSIT